MSEISLYAGLCEGISEYAELVDNVILSLRRGSSSPEEPARQRLANLLNNLASAKCEDLSTRLLFLVLRDSGTTNKAQWQQLGKALLSPRIDNTTMDLLESFARSLEKEQAEAQARIQGWSH